MRHNHTVNNLMAVVQDMAVVPDTPQPHLAPQLPHPPLVPLVQLQKLMFQRLKVT